MNVQHLESLNDLVTELTGVRVRETVPDAVLARADDVVVVDLTPEELLERLRAGRVYPQERIEAALNGFFTVENLVSLREVALRQVAEAVGAQRVTRVELGSRGRSMSGETAASAVAERLLALVRPRPQDQRVVRRAWRSAQRLGAPLDVLWVQPTRDLGDEEDRGLRALRRLCALLGAELHVIESDDVDPHGRGVRARAPHDVRAARLSARRRAGSTASATRCRCASCARSRASTCGSSPTARCATSPRSRRRHGDRRSRARRALWRSAWRSAGGCRRSGRRPARAQRGGTRRILLPFSGEAISTRALDAAFRLALAEGATLMPAYLATVPRSLPLEAALPAAGGPRAPGPRGGRAARGAQAASRPTAA